MVDIWFAVREESWWSLAEMKLQACDRVGKESWCMGRREEKVVVVCRKWSKHAGVALSSSVHVEICVFVELEGAIRR